MPATNRRLAQWLVQWLIEHSISHQYLWYKDSFVLPCLPAGREIRLFSKRQNVSGKLMFIPTILTTHSDDVDHLLGLFHFCNV